MSKVITSIQVDKELWKQFSIAVIQREGNRRKSHVIERLIKQYIEETSQSV